MARGKPVRIYVVITPNRVFTFTSHTRALKFERRARRVPSMRDRSIEFVATTANGSLRNADRQLRPLDWETPCGS